MIKIILRKHRDDPEMLEILTETEVKIHTCPNRTRTTVWGLVHCDLVHDDEVIRKQLEANGEVDVHLVADA